MNRIVVISSRALIADALAEALAEQADVEVWRTTLAALADDDRQVDQQPTCAVIDLDDVVAERELVSAALERLGLTRRIGLFDIFTSHHARLAFDLSVTSLVPLTAPVEAVVAVVLGSSADHRPSSSVVVAAGASRDDLLRLSMLSSRELEVLGVLAAGATLRELAEQLSITPHTASSHKRRLFAKLGLQSHPQVAAFAARVGIDTTTVPAVSD